jgi:hypothetical protein
MSRWALVILVVVAFVAGCSTAGKMSAPASDVPSWVNGPSTFESNGYIYAVGLSGVMGNISLARRAADTNGRAKILRFLNDKPVVNGQKYTEADLVLSEVVQFWRDSEKDITYALARCRLKK